MTNSIPTLASIRIANPNPLQDAVRELSSFTGVTFHVTRKGWRKVLGTYSNGVYLVSAHADVRPPLERLVAWPSTGTGFWLPSARMHDLVSMCEYMGESSVDRLVIWHEFVTDDYGLVYKREYPRIVDSDLLRRFEIDLASVLGRKLSEFVNTIIWWQEWGGHLFSTTLTTCQGRARFSYTSLAERVGKYKRLPYHRIR